MSQDKDVQPKASKRLQAAKNVAEERAKKGKDLYVDATFKAVDSEPGTIRLRSPKAASVSAKALNSDLGS